MNPLKLIMARVAQATVFVVGRLVVGSGTTGVVSLAGASIGDFALVFTNNDVQGAMVPPAGWTEESYTGSGSGTLYTTQVFSKVLTAGDIAAGSATWTNVRSAEGGFVLAVYRGPTSYATRAQTRTASTSAFLAGFAKNSFSRGVVTFLSDRVSADTPTVPSGFTSRSSGVAFTRMESADIIDPANYVNSSNVAWGSLTASESFPAYAWLIELL